MTDYSHPRREPTAADNRKICAHCGWRVSPDDRYCAGCGVTFGGDPPRVESTVRLPGFRYHLAQGLGWGLGFALAGGTVSLFFYALVAMALHGR